MGVFKKEAKYFVKIGSTERKKEKLETSRPIASAESRPATKKNVRK